MKKTLTTILVLTMALLLFTACAVQQEAPVEKDIMNETTDAMGNTVVLSDIVSDDMTIVSTAPSITEILFALDRGDQIIGVDVYSNYPEQTTEIEKVGDFNGFDIEKVISLDPDIVFAGNGLQHEQIAALSDAGLSVFALEPTYYDDIFNSITLIGQLVGKPDEAETLITDIKAVESTIIEAAEKADSTPTVYYVMGIGEYGNWTSGEGSFINTILEMAGGDCITDGTDMEWVDYPVEDLIIADPDVLIVSSWVMEEDLLADPAYSNLSAIKNGNYHFIDPDIIERPGPRIKESMPLIQGFLIGE